MRKLHCLFVMVLFNGTGSAFEGIYLGGNVGQTGLTGEVGGSYGDAIGFGLDVGLRTNSQLDILAGFSTSSHSSTALGDLSLTNFGVAADVHITRINDFEFTLGAGPGFYFFKPTSGNLTKFGLHAGGAIDVLIENLRIGLVTRYHSVFGASGTTGPYWTGMLRVGYLIPLE